MAAVNKNTQTMFLSHVKSMCTGYAKLEFGKGTKLTVLGKFFFMCVVFSTKYVKRYTMYTSRLK